MFACLLLFAQELSFPSRAEAQAKAQQQQL
jgi:hypothetical protein